MIQYFRRLSLIRVSELGAGLIAVSLAFLIATGGTIFGIGKHLNLASIDSNVVKDGMSVEIEINEILDVYATDNTEGGSYYVIPYPITKESSDDSMTLLAVYVPKEYVSKADAIMLATAKGTESDDRIHLNGELRGITDDQKALYKSCVKKVKSSYKIDDANVLELVFVPSHMRVIDYIATALAIIVIVWFIAMLVYILSNKNQAHVASFFLEHGLNQEEFEKEISNGKKFGKLVISPNYVAFMMLYKVYVFNMGEIDDIYQYERPSLEDKDTEAIKEDLIVIRLKNKLEYKISLRNQNMDKLLLYLNNNSLPNTKLV